MGLSKKLGENPRGQARGESGGQRSVARGICSCKDAGTVKESQTEASGEGRREGGKSAGVRP